MKNLLCLICVLLMGAPMTYAKKNGTEKKSISYTAFAYSSAKIQFPDIAPKKISTKIGGAFFTGRSYMLHRKPIGGVLKFGLDATWVDINYGNYEDKVKDEIRPNEFETIKFTYHQAEIGMQFGPSITITPIERLRIHAYFRYAPCYSAFYDSESESAMGNYATFFVGGACVTYRAIGLGVESRFGNSNYKTLKGFDEDDPGKIKMKTSGFRAYFALRF